LIPALGTSPSATAGDPYRLSRVALTAKWREKISWLHHLLPSIGRF
jgi:hypothetical protein